MVRIFLLSLLLFAAPAWAADVLDTKALAALPNLANPAPNLATAGELQANDIAVIARAGIRHVIDLRVDSETPDFDEAVAVRAAGMLYHNLPIRGADDLTPENVARFDRLITEVGAAPTLIHCSSSNRVGALAALRAAWVHGQPVEAALAEGKRWGLKALEPAVRERMAASASAQALARRPLARRHAAAPDYSRRTTCSTSRKHKNPSIRHSMTWRPRSSSTASAFSTITTLNRP